MNIRSFSYCRTVPWECVHFFLQSLFSLDCSNWMISIPLSSKFNDSFLCHLYSAHWVHSENLKIFSYCSVFFPPKISIWFLFIFAISLLRLSVFPFVSKGFTLIYWSMVMMVTLKLLSDNSNIFFISRLISVNFLFLHKVLRFSWLFKCQVILDCVWDILNIMWLWVTWRVWYWSLPASWLHLNIWELFSSFELFYIELLIFHQFCFSRVFMGNFLFRRAQILHLEI